MPALAIPATLHEALLARLDRLGSAKGVAQLGATLGRQFPYALLRAVAPLEDEPLQRDLATLVAAELLYQRGQPPRAVYTFKHALIQEAAYESVLKRVRRQTHQRIVQVLEAQFPETAATAARTAGPPCAAGRAVGPGRGLFPAGWGTGVGPLGLSGGGGRLRAGAGSLAAPPREPRHTRAGHRSPPRAAQCALAPGRARAALRQLTGSRKPSPRPWATHTGWGGSRSICSPILWQACEPDHALASGQRALAIAAALGEVGLTVAAQYYLGNVYRSLGDYRQAVELLPKERGVSPRRAAPGALRSAGLASVLSRSHLVASLAECGAFAEGRAPAEEGVRIAEAADHPYSRVMAYWAMGFRALRQGDLPQAIPVLERALDLAQEAHIRLLVPWVAAPLGAAYALAGRTAEALPLLEQAVEQAVAMRFMFDHALRVVWLGEAYLLRRPAGRGVHPGAAGPGVLPGAPGTGPRSLRPAAPRRGRGAAQPPEVEQAEAHYQQALALAEELGMRPLQAHCHRGLGTLYGQMGRLEQARAALSTAIAHVPRHGDDLLAAPGRGGAGTSRRLTCGDRRCAHWPSSREYLSTSPSPVAALPPYCYDTMYALT